MRIEKIHRERHGDRTRVRASVHFEHCDLLDRVLYVECTGSAGVDLAPTPDAFLLMALPLACWMGEQRVRVDGAVCTRVHEGLQDAMRLFAHWYPRARPVRIEATGGLVASRPRAERRTGALLSGGVDSLAMFRANRECYPLDHPDAIQEAVFLRGINTMDFDDCDRLRLPYARSYERCADRLRALGRAMAFDLTILDTNVRRLYPTWPVFRDIGWGAAFLAPTLMLGARFTDVHLASTGVGLPNLQHGSHPALDPLYSSAAVCIHHPQPFRTRLDKLAAVSSWPEGMDVLDVCLRIEAPTDGLPNCGRCHKCVRTMLGLRALGRLADAPTFPFDDVTTDMIKAAPIVNDALIGHMQPMVALLESEDRQDLADAIRKDIRRYLLRRRPHRRFGRALRRLLRSR